MLGLAVLCLAALCGARAARDYDSWCLGNCDRDAVVSETTGGAVIMGGGKDTDEAFMWQSTHANGGDFVVLRASGDDAYNEYIMGLSAAAGKKLNSVTTILFNNRRASSDSSVLKILKNAEALFMAGGDQGDYLDLWGGTDVQKILQDKLMHNVTVGGTSAGCAVLGGAAVYTGEKGSITSEDALANPYDRAVTLTDAFLKIPFLETIVTDTHFVTRDRMGRMLTFVARLLHDGKSVVRGLGVDEHTALLLNVDNGSASVVGIGTAYLCGGENKPIVCKEKTPLSFTDIQCQRVAVGDSVSFATFSSTGLPYTNSVVEGKFATLPYGPQN